MANARPEAAPSKPVPAASQDDLGPTSNALLMGIDLGTSRSSVVASNGKRKTVQSYVGFAKDPVSRKFLGTDVIYGKAALDNRLSVDLYRPLEHGVIKSSETDNSEEYKKNIEAARLLIQHLVDLAEPGRGELLYGVVGVPSQATVKNKKAIIDATKGILDAVMIVSEPFTVAYSLGRMSDVLVVDIGAGTTDLCRMHGTVPGPEDEISLTVAGDAIDRRLHELIMKKWPQAQLTVNMCKEFKELYGYVSGADDKIVVNIPVNGKPTPHDITALMHEACMILVEPVVDSIHKLVASFNPEFQERIRNNIVLSGGGSQIDGLNKAVEDRLNTVVGGGKVTCVDDALYAGAEGALQLAIDMPSDYWQQLR